MGDSNYYNQGTLLMDEAFRIGSRLKSKRNSSGYSIKSLSEKTGVSTGQISQIEQGKVTPSVVCLYKLANALGVDLNYFFESEMEVIIQKPENRNVVITNEGRNIYEILSPYGTRNHIIDFTKITIKANSSYDDDDSDISHEGEECGYVIKGSMVVHIDGEDIVLKEGDSIYYKSGKPHHYENPFDEDCISIWAMTPLFF